MLCCDLLELRLERVNESKIRYLLFSDLPPGTLAILSCQRTYRDAKGNEALWIGYNERIEFKPSINGDYAGCIDEIDVAASDRKAHCVLVQRKKDSDRLN